MGTQNHVSRLTWKNVSARLAAGAAAILPIGAGAKQHGVHLPMDTDQIQAEWFAKELANKFDALVWPTLTYGHYPAFVAYAGSVSLSEHCFETVVCEVAQSLVTFGARAVWILNTGLSTIAPIDRALTLVRPAGCCRHLSLYSGAQYRRVVSNIGEQPHGSHADEIETSIMLAISPGSVNMQRAEDSPPLDGALKPGPLTPADARSPNYSASGSFGNPTFASEAKGRFLVEAILLDLTTAILGPK